MNEEVIHELGNLVRKCKHCGKFNSYDVTIFRFEGEDIKKFIIVAKRISELISEELKSMPKEKNLFNGNVEYHDYD